LVIHLEYGPQVWFIYGAVITISTIISSLSFFILKKSNIVPKFLQLPTLSISPRRVKIIKEKWINDIHITNRFQALESNKAQSKICHVFGIPSYLFIITHVMFTLAGILSLQGNSESVISLGMIVIVYLSLG
jgi:hypothetical protein